MKRQGVLVGIGLAGAAVVACALWFLNREAPEAVPPLSHESPVNHAADGAPESLSQTPEVPSVTTSSDNLRAGGIGTELPGSTTEVHTPEDGLQEFFGIEWDRLRPLYAKRIPLDAQLPGKLVAWKDVSGQVCSRMRVSDTDLNRMRIQYAPATPLSADSLRQRYHIQASLIRDYDLMDLESRLLNTRAQLEGLLERFRRVVDIRLAAKCAGGDFDYMPYSDVELKHVPKKSVYLSSFTVADWVVTYGVATEEDSELPEIMNELKSCSASAREIIHEYFADRK